MFVRTVYVTGDPAQVDTAIRALNSQGRDLLEERPGYRGSGVFVDRELGKLLAVSWWQTEEARRNSDEVMRERRASLLEPFAATTAVDHSSSSHPKIRLDRILVPLCMGAVSLDARRHRRR